MFFDCVRINAGRERFKSDTGFIIGRSGLILSSIRRPGWISGFIDFMICNLIYIIGLAL